MSRGHVAGPRVLVSALALTCIAACARSVGQPAGSASGGEPAELAPQRLVDEDSGPNVPVIGLRRGGQWSVLSIRPPHLKGPQFHLVLRNGVLTGAISGGTAPSGTLRVTISQDGAQGFGPLGPISMDYFEQNNAMVAEGTWNGGRVHLTFADGYIKGTVATNSFFYARSNASGTSGADLYRVPGLTGRAAEMLTPVPEDASCEYYLDQLGVDGALTGGSTCGGMPQQTRLEVPEVAQDWLTQPELMTVLVAVLAAPPYVNAEAYGPRFDSPSTSSFPSSRPIRRR